MKRLNSISFVFIMAFLLCSLHNTTVTYAEEFWPEAPNVSAESAIVIEVETGAILYEKNSHDQHYPASITKIMTSLLAIENCPLSDTVHFSKDSVYKVEGTQVGITPDEDVPLDECLYGIMLASGNEIAYAVAEHVGGTFEDFVKMMNNRAVELGCTNTHFNNPHGLPDENHYTCAYDMALIARQAYKNDIFRNISGTTYHVIPPTNLFAQERPISNHHKMLINSSYNYAYCTGGKTGYTNAARYNLVTYAEKDGMVLACVIMKDEESALQYQDTTNLFNYCFDNFHKIKISDTALGNNLESSGLFPIENNLFSENTSTISFEENAAVIIPNTVDASALTYNVNYATDKSVFIKYTYGEHLLGNVPIVYNQIQNPAATAVSTPAAESNKNFLKINVKIILYVVIGIITLALMALIILKFLIRYRYTNTIDFHRRKSRSWRGKE